MPFAAAGNEICLFVFTDKNITRHVYDSAGNIKTSVQSKDGFTITYAAAVKDGFFAAGYERNGRNYKPRARVLAADGVLRRELPESNDYESASFYTAAQKDANTWLFAGNGVKNGYFGAAAYARLVRDEGSNLTAVKEWGGIDFPECRDIKSAVYSHIHDCWFVTGEKTEPFNGSYLARINNDGTIQIIDSFEEKYFLKILIDDNGGIYLAGEEQKSNETFAALVKYNADGKKIWQFLNQPPSHSCYYTAVFDDKESRIVLAGTLQAKDQYAAGGKPFIEAVGMADGSPVWREIFSDPEFDKTALASAVIPAPDYGYVLALSGGVGNDYKDKPPFKIARINSQGKLKKY
ncbi:MAG: hypothetical protein LBU85_05300 [Treponema sp.]|nr:hypothetical protein [Treponema sp.]